MVRHAAQRYTYRAQRCTRSTCSTQRCVHSGRVKKLGNFGAFVASWQGKDFADFLEYLHKHGDRLGDKRAQYFLREAGLDSYVLSFDALNRLSLEGVADKPPTSSKQRRAIQTAFDAWKEESGKSLTYISRLLAMSVQCDRQPRFT